MAKVKVRIGLAVDADGAWWATGWRGAFDGEMLSNARGGVDAGARGYFIEAEVETPEPLTVIQGNVSEVKS